MMVSPATHRALVVAAALCFATTGTAAALGPADAPSLALGAARVLVGALGLVAVCGWAVRPGRLRLPASPAVLWGALGVAGYQATFFLAVRSTGVAVGTVVALGSAPVATGLLAWLRGAGRPTPRWAVATGLAVAGLALLTLARDGDAVRPLGVTLALGAGLSYAIYTLATKALLDAGHGPAESVASVFAGGAALSSPLLLVGDPGWLAGLPGLATVAWLGLVTTTLAYVLFARGLAGLPAAEVSTLTLAEPVGATLLGLLVLGERLSWTSTVGLACIVAGLSALVLAPSRRPATAAPA